MIDKYQRNIAHAKHYKEIVMSNPDSIDTSQKSIKQWVNYYDEIIKANQKALNSCGRVSSRSKINGSKTVNSNLNNSNSTFLNNTSFYAMLFFIFASLFTTTLVSEDNFLTGFVVKEEIDYSNVDLNKKEIINSTDLELLDKTREIGKTFSNKLSWKDGDILELPVDAFNIVVNATLVDQIININDKVKVIDELNEASIIDTDHYIDLNTFNIRKNKFKDELKPELLQLIIDQKLYPNLDDIIVYYDLKEPDVIEEFTAPNKKKITVSSENHFEDIKITSKLPIPAKKEMIKIKWLNNETDEIIYIIPEVFIDEDGDGLIEEVEWIIPHLSTQEFEIEIVVLNVQSYPIVGGNWTVRFDTVGTANLSIRPIDINWSNENEDGDLKLLHVNCGETLLDYQWIDDEVFIENYSCNETGSETSKVITTGVHKLQFQFGDSIAYGSNDATNAPVVNSLVINSTDGLNGTDENVTVYINSTDADGDTIENITDWRVESVSIGIHYPYEGGSNSTWTREYSSYGINATVTGATWNRTAGYDGFAAYEFDGVNDQINSTVSFIPKTYVFRFKPRENYTSADSGRTNILKQGAAQFYIESGKMGFDYAGDEILSTTINWTNGTWYTVYANYDLRNLSISIDNVKETSDTATAPFRVQDSSEDTVASFFENGDISLTGTCAVSTCNTPSDDSFIIQNSSGSTVAFINETGDMCLQDGDCTIGDASCGSAPDGSFIVQDSIGTNVAYINNTGGLCAIGTLYENQ